MYVEKLFEYKQTKTQKSNNLSSKCEITAYLYDDMLQVSAHFNFDYLRFGELRKVGNNHFVIINLKKGDIKTTYQIERVFDLKTKSRTRNNDFNQIHNFIESGIRRGEKRLKYWGVRYDRSMDQLTNLIYNTLKGYYPNIEEKGLYEMLVDFFIFKKGIKAHDNIYDSIMVNLPARKWLKENENKFIPALLDSHGIKSKYFIGVLNQQKNIDVRTLKYLCNLFGDNHLDYIKQIDWTSICKYSVPNKRIHTLKNNSEKSNMVKVINDWTGENSTHNTYQQFTYLCNQLFTHREYIESRGLDLKFKCDDYLTFYESLKTWESTQKYFKKGYRIRYGLPEDFVKDIESPIQIDGNIFQLRILKTEEDFAVEAMIMKNCLAKQFISGSIHIYITMWTKNKRINLQYKRGNLHQGYGKANTEVDVLFKPAIKELSKKMSKYSGISWKKERYDFV